MCNMVVVTGVLQSYGKQPGQSFRFALYQPTPFCYHVNMATTEITIPVLFDPLTRAVCRLAEVNFKFANAITALANQGNCFVVQYKNGKLVAHLSDAALDLFYEANT